MAQTTLVTEPSRTSLELAAYLDDHGVPLAGAFWMLDEDSEIWYLYVASDVVSKQGIRRAYEVILEALDTLGSDIPLAQIKAITPRNPLMVNLRTAMTVPPWSWVVFRNSSANGTFIKAAVLLRTA